MITIIILIYLVIGIMVTAPFFIIEIKFGDFLDLFEEYEITDTLTMLEFGIGALVSVIIWPYWVVLYVCEECLKPDKD